MLLLSQTRGSWSCNKGQQHCLRTHHHHSCCSWGIRREMWIQCFQSKGIEFCQGSASSVKNERTSKGGGEGSGCTISRITFLLSRENGFSWKRNVTKYKIAWFPKEGLQIRSRSLSTFSKILKNPLFLHQLPKKSPFRIPWLGLLCNTTTISFKLI